MYGWSSKLHLWRMEEVSHGESSHPIYRSQWNANPYIENCVFLLGGGAWIHLLGSHTSQHIATRGATHRTFYSNPQILHGTIPASTQQQGVPPIGLSYLIHRYSTVSYQPAYSNKGCHLRLSYLIHRYPTVPYQPAYSNKGCHIEDFFHKYSTVPYQPAHSNKGCHP